MSNFFYVLDKTVRLLFVDDDPILREFAQVNLASPSARIETAADGAEALERLAAADYDIVLLDLEMPVLDGFEASRRIRAIELSEGWPPVAIIALTASAFADDRARSLAAGMDEHMAKPLRSDQLAAVMQRLLPAAETGLEPTPAAG